VLESCSEIDEQLLVHCSTLEQQLAGPFIFRRQFKEVKGERLFGIAIARVYSEKN
jgi:hypothetical protein